MNRCATLIALLLLRTPVAAQAQDKPQADSAVAKKADVMLSDVAVHVRGKHLQCTYRVENNSAHDIWSCRAMDDGCVNFETAWGEDRQTFVIRKRTDIKWDVAREQPTARYVRLKMGRHLADTLLVPLPLRAQGVVSSEGVPPNAEYVGRIVLEIGYYEGDLPSKIRDSLERNEGTRKQEHGPAMALLFDELNTYYGNRDNQVFFPVDPKRSVKGERVLRAFVDGQHLPQKESDGHPLPAPDLRNCSRLEITYEASALEYFFPYEDQQRLFDAAEVQYLRSPLTVVVDDPTKVKEFASQVGKGLNQGISIGSAKARVACYRDNDRLAMLEVYDDCLVSGAGEPFACPEPYIDEYFERFRGLASQVQPFELRVACARGLRGLYNRFRVHAKAEQQRLARSREDKEVRYPAPTEWCDSIISMCHSIGIPDSLVEEPFQCRSAGEGKCHYAMNPNCKLDSPADTVLLFEARAGWNQHGGPELFTFDNHKPRGGLALLNDGTVNFVRTERELRELRWK